MGQQNDDRRHSETKILLRGPWPQTGQEPRRSSQETGPRNREGSHLSERRGGACGAQRVYQSPARSRRTTRASGRFYGQGQGERPLQLAAVAVLIFVLAGCGGAPKHTARVAPPPEATRTRPVTAPPSEPDTVVTSHGKTLYTEVGRASWYGPGLQYRHAANRAVFDMNRMSAAH